MSIRIVFAVIAVLFSTTSMAETFGVTGTCTTKNGQHFNCSFQKAQRQATPKNDPLMELLAKKRQSGNAGKEICSTQEGKSFFSLIGGKDIQLAEHIARQLGGTIKVGECFALYPDGRAVWTRRL